MPGENENSHVPLRTRRAFPGRPSVCGEQSGYRQPVPVALHLHLLPVRVCVNKLCCVLLTVLVLVLTTSYILLNYIQSRHQR